MRIAFALAAAVGFATVASGVVHLRYPVEIPMRDGQTLAADVYLPAESGVWPTILIQTPYGKHARFPFIFLHELSADPLLKSPDYAFVVLDWRGFYGSAEAAYEGSPTHAEDGYDAVEWIAMQPWSTGKVGTWGLSALGNIQLNTAAERPPHLCGCVPIVYSYRPWYDLAYAGGVYTRSRNEFNYGYYGGLDMVRGHPLYDQAWQYVESHTGDPGQIDVPMLHISGWYDHEVVQTVREMEALRCEGMPGARGQQKLLIGPWSHSAIGDTQQGQRAYPAAESASSVAALEFFDYHLRGIPNGYATRPVVRYFRVNDDVWRPASAWPPATARPAQFYLTADGSLSPTAPVLDDTLTYVSDPTDPVPTLWGAVLSSDYATQGPGNLTSIEARADVLTFTTPVLAEPLSIEGRPTARLWIDCDAVNTDLAVRMTEVTADGRSMLLVDGIRRASLRNGFTRHEWLEPGTVYAVEVRLPPVAVTIPAGHALRISVAPSNYDRFDVNMQDGSDISDEPGTTPIVATVRLHVGPQHPSHVSLPLADARAPSDFNADGGTDITDFERFVNCWAGPGVFCPSGECERADFYAADLDYTGAVDLADFAALQRAAGPAPREAPRRATVDRPRAPKRAEQRNR